MRRILYGKCDKVVERNPISSSTHHLDARPLSKRRLVRATGISQHYVSVTISKGLKNSEFVISWYK